MCFCVWFLSPSVTLPRFSHVSPVSALHLVREGILCLLRTLHTLFIRNLSTFPPLDPCEQRCLSSPREHSHGGKLSSLSGACTPGARLAPCSLRRVHTGGAAGPLLILFNPWRDCRLVDGLFFRSSLMIEVRCVHRPKPRRHREVSKNENSKSPRVGPPSFSGGGSPHSQASTTRSAPLPFFLEVKYLT